MFRHSPLPLMLAAIGLGFAMSASAADLTKCTSCHGTIAKDHAGAAHKDVACSTCHTGLDQHLANMKTRPTVNFDRLRRLPYRSVQIPLCDERPSGPSVEEGRRGSRARSLL